ncbi:unnamed protein product, partial [Dicrocoelium dendriticum]
MSPTKQIWSFVMEVNLWHRHCVTRLDGCGPHNLSFFVGVSDLTMNDAALLVHRPVSVRQNRAGHSHRCLAKRQHIVGLATETSQVSSPGKPSTGCTKEKIPTRFTCQSMVRTISADMAEARSYCLFVYTGCGEASNPAVPVMKKKAVY